MYTKNELAQAEELLKENNQTNILNTLNQIDESKKEKLIKQILNLNFEQLKRLYQETKEKPEILDKKLEHIKYVDKYKLSEEKKSLYTKIGEDPNDIPNNLMPYITGVASGKLEILSVFGNDYPTKDGTGVRDYIHVVDLAKGHLKALEKLEKEGKGIYIYNLGTGKGYSVLEMVKTFETATGKNVKYKIVGRRDGDIATCYANSKKAKEELGWQAEKTLEDMCKDAWRYIEKNK